MEVIGHGFIVLQNTAQAYIDIKNGVNPVKAVMAAAATAGLQEFITTSGKGAGIILGVVGGEMVAPEGGGAVGGIVGDAIGGPIAGAADGYYGISDSFHDAAIAGPNQ